MMLTHIAPLNCRPDDKLPQERRNGGIFEEIKYDNIAAHVLEALTPIACSAQFYLADQDTNQRKLLDFLQENSRGNSQKNFFTPDEAMMLVNKAADPFLKEPNRQYIAYLADRRYHLLAESFTKKVNRNEEMLIKRILLCRINPNYLFPAGTGIIMG